MNLLVSLLFIGLVVMSLAMPCLLYFGSLDVNGPNFSLSEEQFHRWLALGVIGCLVVGTLATVVPLRIGIRAFQKMEF